MYKHINLLILSVISTIFFGCVTPSFLGLPETTPITDAVSINFTGASIKAVQVDGKNLPLPKGNLSRPFYVPPGDITVTVNALLNNGALISRKSEIVDVGKRKAAEKVSICLTDVKRKLSTPVSWKFEVRNKWGCHGDEPE